MLFLRTGQNNLEIICGSEGRLHFTFPWLILTKTKYRMNDKLLDADASKNKHSGKTGTTLVQMWCIIGLNGFVNPEVEATHVFVSYVCFATKKAVCLVLPGTKCDRQKSISPGTKYRLKCLGYLYVSVRVKVFQLLDRQGNRQIFVPEFPE